VAVTDLTPTDVLSNLLEHESFQVSTCCYGLSGYVSLFGTGHVNRFAEHVL
jgi:hypothetical protein